ncbi:DUF1850 domain-containing protein [Desulforamulus ferrireducens]|uniref:DUF1850 domain-containing protein n=1 Tax=Desulforamulus ferrireducens TaxID=1833852 RepID=A0A1S6ISA9_9FIRM|nr:DUF1850 domain-containing protein [Desulforamulus ferrireducens]AQS57660.1 hypothetical protein B0537_00055 [Desulforamulus ferrireducens]
MNRQRTKRFFLGLLLASVLVGALLPLPTLLVGEQQGATRLAIPLVLDQSFTYEYLHSVLKTPVQEKFILAPGHDLLLESTTYQSLGVGTPFLPGEGELENHNGLYVLKGQNRTFHQLNLGLVDFTKQAILYRGSRYELADFFTSGSLIELQVKSMTPAELIWLSLQSFQERR